MSRILLRGGRLIDPARGVDEICDLLIGDGAIEQIAGPPGLGNPEGATSIDVAGCWVVPGLIDSHVHLRDPGFPEKETIATGLRAALWPLRVVGYFLFLVVLCRVAIFSIPAHQFLLNARFALFVVWVACFVLAWRFTRAPGVEVSDVETPFLACIAIAANIGALAALSLEIWDAIGRMPSLAIDRGLAQELALSSLWLVYAIGLMIAGLAKKWPELRWQSLTLLGVVIGKVFFVDLSFLDRFYRIVSFLLLGLVLMTVSFYYQRRLAAQRNEKKAS